MVLTLKRRARFYVVSAGFAVCLDSETADITTWCGWSKRALCDSGQVYSVNV